MIWDFPVFVNVKTMYLNLRRIGQKMRGTENIARIALGAKQKGFSEVL
jgi:hypothetical protein